MSENITAAHRDERVRWAQELKAQQRDHRQAFEAMRKRTEQAERERDELRERVGGLDAGQADLFGRCQRAEADNAALLAELRRHTAHPDCMAGDEMNETDAHPGAALLERMRALEEAARNVLETARTFNHAEACEVEDEYDHDETEGCRCFLKHLPALHDALKVAP